MEAFSVGAIEEPSKSNLKFAGERDGKQQWFVTPRRLQRIEAFILQNPYMSMPWLSTSKG